MNNAGSNARIDPWMPEYVDTLVTACQTTAPS
jgi:hypothetical protein